MTTATDGDWIAVDWGTTNMRASLVGENGTVGARAADGPGMVPIVAQGDGAAGFERALLRAVGDWLGDEPVDVLVCGMAGARQGWVEAPYREVPADLEGLLDAAIRVRTDDRRLAVRIVPGLCVRGDRPDVMRGEETQLLGLLQGTAADRVCLPGTHSKWVDLDGARVAGFRTHMTGELNAVLSAHSILTPTLTADPDAGFDEEAFDAAVRTAVNVGGAIMGRLFAIRAASLLAGESAASARATLSGLLIGAEIVAETGAKAGARCATVHLIGGGSLTALYSRALAIVGVKSVTHDGGDLAVAGLAAMRQGGR